MQISEDKGQRLTCPSLPLAVYREVAAYLRQVRGAKAGLWPAYCHRCLFDYDRSQVGGIWIEYPEDAEDSDRQRVAQILAYYSDRFGPWQQVDASMETRVQ